MARHSPQPGDHVVRPHHTHMNNKIAGAILLSASGLVAAVGAVGSQIAFAIVRGQFYVSKISGEVPPGPEGASLHWSVILAVIVLAAVGIVLLFRPSKSD